VNRKCFSLFLVGCLIGVSLLGLGFLAKSVQAVNYYVDPSGTDDGSHGTAIGTDAFQTIQYAIGDTRVIAGDTINVAAGEYAEQINITKAIALTGTGGTTIIKPTSLDVYVTTPSGTTTGIIVVNDIGDTVTVGDLVVDASSLSNDRDGWFGSTIPDMRFGGVFFYNTSGLIESVSSINNDHVTIPVGSEEWKRGIHSFWADADITSAKTVEISRCTASNFLSSGIQIGETTTNITANIQSNVINGGGILTTRQQNGIKVNDGATVTVISSNAISDLHYNTSDWDTAIEVINIQDGAVIEDNTIINCDFGITNRHSSEIIIQHNNITGSTHIYGTGIYLDNEEANIVNATVHGNTISSGFSLGGICMEGWTPNSNTVSAEITDNTLTGDGTSGSVGIFDWGGGTVTASVTGNSISNWNNGIFLEDGVSISGYDISENLIFDNTTYNLHNNDASIVDAINNWWGSKIYKPIKSTLSGVASLIPYYINNNKTILIVTVVGDTATVDASHPQVMIENTILLANITVDSGVTDPIIDVSDFITSGTGTLPEINIFANNVGGIGISIPASTTIISADTAWDGLMLAPTAISTTIPEVSGEIRTVETAIDVGVTDVKLSFDKAVRILFPNESGNGVGYIRSGISFTEITTTCDSDSGATLGVDEDCKIDVGDDLVVWTRHFTKFITFSSVSTITPTPTPTSTPTPTPTPTPTSSPSTSTTTSSTSTGWAAPACSATKPGSAPIITNTVNGDNSVTLTWLKANNPFTHYLIGYGTSSGSIEYGNPNVGNADTTSYTVKGLSGGTRYYFKIKAINDCMPGDWSNEVSEIPVGNVIVTETTATPAEGFVPVSQIPSELFDIALIVDKTQINSAAELAARVTFVSFGKEETPVEMIFTVIDANGKEYYRSVDNTSIQTEGVFNKTFEGLLLDKGKYTLVLTTLYNTNVKDEFKQDFEVGEVTVSPVSKLLENKPLVSIIGSGIILILISWIIGLVRRKKK